MRDSKNKFVYESCVSQSIKTRQGVCPVRIPGAPSVEGDKASWTYTDAVMLNDAHDKKARFGRGAA